MKIPQLICKPPAQTQFCIQSWNIKQYAVNHNGEVNFLEHRLTYPFPFSLATPPHQLSTPSSQHFPRSHSQLFTFPHCWHYITLICSRFFVLFGLYFNTYYSFFTAETLFTNLKWRRRKLNYQHELLCSLCHIFLCGVKLLIHNLF